MVALLTMVCASVVISSWAYDKNPLNPITLMFLLWMIWIPFSAAGFYGMDSSSVKTYTIVMVGLIAYLAGCLLGWNPVQLVILDRRGGTGCRCLMSLQYRLDYRVLYILCGVAIAFYAYQMTKVFSLLTEGYGMADVRAMVFSKDENEMRTSSLIVIMQYFVAEPATYLMTAILPIELFYGRKNKLIIIASITMTMLWVLTTGGRILLLFSIMSFVCIILHERWKPEFRFPRRIPTRIKALIMLGAVGVAGLILYITLARKGKNVDMFRQFCIYYAAPIKMLDYYTENIDINYPNLLGFGMSSFYGFIYPIMFLLRLLGIFHEYPVFMNTIHDLSVTQLQEVVQLGGNIRCNAFVTLFYQPYLDGRFLGVIVVLFLFGFVCGKTYYRWAYQGNFKHLLLYLLFLQKIIFSMIRFWFTQPGQVVALVLAMLLVFRRENAQAKQQPLRPEIHTVEG